MSGRSELTSLEFKANRLPVVSCSEPVEDQHVRECWDCGNVAIPENELADTWVPAAECVARPRLTTRRIV